MLIRTVDSFIYKSKGYLSINLDYDACAGMWRMRGASQSPKIEREHLELHKWRGDRHSCECVLLQ